MSAPAEVPCVSPGVLDWPDPDVLVLRNRPLRTGTDPATLSRYQDSLWHLAAAHPDAHRSVGPLRWDRYPPGLRDTFKALFLAALDHPYPLSGPGAHRPGQKASVATLIFWFIDLLVLATWMHDRVIVRLRDLTDTDLDAYRSYLLGLTRSPARKADMLAVVRTLWLYRDHLPADAAMSTSFPWVHLAAKDLVKMAPEGPYNKTPRISAATMDPLLAWALRVIEVIGPDVRDAWLEYRQLEDGAHPSQARYSGLGTSERIGCFLAGAAAAGTPLPGNLRRPGTVNCGHVLRLVGVPRSQRAGADMARRSRIAATGLPVAADTYIGVINGRIGELSWRDQPITVSELPTLLRLLYADGFVVICYLSGMRPGEVLNLPRSCRASDSVTGELLVIGRRGNGFDRSPLAPQTPQSDRPWVVVTPVHTAIALLESLGDFPLLFPASPISAHAARPNTTHARSSAAINRDLEDFLAWINVTFVGADGQPPIPPDSTKHLHASRLRRTLAHFIVRRPRGLIAAALQYGHVSTRVTLSYAGAADTSWVDDLAVEKLELVLEQNSNDLQRLSEGEHVSGPSAHEYRARLEATARFEGRVVQTVRNASRLLDSIDADIHHGEGMTCVWRPETALCRRARVSTGLPVNEAPEQSECRSARENLAYTDRDVTTLREQLTRWQSDAADPLSPAPLRERAATKATRVSVLIDRHDQQRTPPPGPSASADAQTGTR